MRQADRSALDVQLQRAAAPRENRKRGNSRAVFTVYPSVHMDSVSWHRDKSAAHGGKATPFERRGAVGAYKRQLCDQMPGGVKRPSMASHPPSATSIVPVT